MVAMSERTLPTSGRRVHNGPDRITVLLASLTAFLLVLALLATQFSGASSARVARRPAVLRRIYETTVVERVLPAGVGKAGATSVTQSVSGSQLPAAAPVTRTS